MKIAWVSYDFEEYSALHVNEMAEQHEVLMVVPQADADGTRYRIDERVLVHAFEKPRLRQPGRQLISVRKLLAVIDRFSPDVVHLQQGHLWFNFALPILKRKYPLVITVHDPRHHAGDRISQKTPQWVIDFGFRRADQVIVHGQTLREQVRRLFGFAEDQVHVIPHVAMGKVADADCAIEEAEAGDVVSDEPTAGKPAGKTTLREQPECVLFFGRIWDYKGLDYLIESEPWISAQVPNVKIVIAGEGDDFERYRNQIRNEERFEIHNRWISDEQRAEFFERAALVVLPYNEATQSGVVPVAYNYSKPVVATDVGALAECVQHGQTGLLVPPRDPQCLASAIVQLLKDSSLRHRMGQAGKAFLDDRASPKRVAAATIEVYQRASGRRPTEVAVNPNERVPMKDNQSTAVRGVS